MDLNDISKNQKRSKKREWNDYSKVTNLVKKYKKSKKDEDLIEILKELEGIINSFTIILTPGNTFQQIHINPFMAKFLGMFLTPEEKGGSVTVETYYRAISRVRWIMRRFDYNDIYSHILHILIHTIKSMKIVGDCDCIYYIQLIARYKMHDFVMKTSKDAGVSIADIPINYDDHEENLEEVLDRLSFSPENMEVESNLISDLYENIDLSILLRNDDIWKYFSPYEKYLIYLKDFLDLTNKQVLSILRFETKEELEERLEDISYKCEIIMKEGD